MLRLLLTLPLLLGTAQEAATGLVADPPVHHLEALAREPMLLEHPSGRIFVTGYPSQITGTDPRSAPRLWSSDDGGASWSRLDVGTPADGAMGNSDVDLTLGPDGTVYFLAMGFDRGSREGTHVAIGVSQDVGATWSWALISETRFDDRPWVRVAPDGTAHVVWNDGAGVRHAVSTDRGHTWSKRPRIHDAGGSSHLAIGPAGEVAVRIAPIAASGNRLDAGVDLIAVSTDGGTTWSKHPAPGEREWDPTLRNPDLVPRWVEPVGWDAAGNLYALWTERREVSSVKLARSSDRGVSWQVREIAAHDRIAYFPYMVSSADGKQLAASWFVGSGDVLAVMVARIGVPLDRDLEVETARVIPDSWLDTTETRARNSAGEYAPVIVLANGDLGVATSVQDPHQNQYGFTWWRLRSR